MSLNAKTQSGQPQPKQAWSRARREAEGRAGRGMFGQGMAKRQSLDLFLCRTFLCRFLPQGEKKPMVRGMMVRGIIVQVIFPIPLTIIPLTNLLENERLWTIALQRRKSLE